MAVDASIFGQYLQPVKSVQDYANAMDQQEQNKLALAAAQLQNRAAQQQYQDDQTYRQAAMASGGDTNKLVQALFSAGLPKQAQAVQTAGLTNKKTQADIDLSGAHAADFQSSTNKRDWEQQQAKQQQAIKDLVFFDKPQDALAGLDQKVKAGVIQPDMAQLLGKQLFGITDPGQMAQWQVATLRKILTPQEQVTMATPKSTEVTDGTSKFFVDNNPTSPTFGQRIGAAPIQMQVTPGEALSANTSRANNAATIAAEYARQGRTLDQALLLNGFVPQSQQGGMPQPAAPQPVQPGQPGQVVQPTQAGQPAPAKPGAAGRAPVQQLVLSPALEAEAQMIAAGKAAPPSGMAATRPQTAALMARVQQINPDFDASTWGAKAKAARDFSTGQQGNAMRSFAVGGQHLDQLAELVQALDNGDNQTLNKIANKISVWTGNNTVTNFDAAKSVVSKEVIKALVGASGGVAERQELSEELKNAQSPRQLLGAIKQYRILMSAQHEALLAQRRAAGLPDSTLPNYAESTGGSPAATPGKVVNFSDLK